MLELQSRVDIRNYVLNYLWSQPKLAQFVVQGLVSLFSRITKLGWFDSDKEEFMFRAVIPDVTKFIQGSAEHCMVGVQLLSQLVCEVIMMVKRLLSQLYFCITDESDIRGRCQQKFDKTQKNSLQLQRHSAL